MLKNEDNNFQKLLKLKIAFSKFLKNKDLKNPLKIVKKMKTALCAGSPSTILLYYIGWMDGHFLLYEPVILSVALTFDPKRTQMLLKIFTTARS